MKTKKTATLAITVLAVTIFATAAYCFLGGPDPSRNMGNYRSFSFYADRPGNAASAWMQPGAAPPNSWDEFWFDNSGNFTLSGGLNTPGPVSIGRLNPVTASTPQYFDKLAGNAGHECGNAITSCIETLKCYMPSGTYSYATSPDFAISGLLLWGSGPTTILQHTGSGNAFNMDAGASPAKANDIYIANLTIQGNSNSTNGIYLHRVHRFNLDNLAVTGCSTTGAALEASFDVLGLINNFTVSSSIGSFTSTPQYGIYLTDESTTTYPTTLVFNNTIIEGVTGAGINIQHGHKYIFNGGTSESNGIGVILGTDACSCIFNGIDTEANVDDDWDIYGDLNTLQNIAWKTLHIYSGATYNEINSGSDKLSGASTIIDGSGGFNMFLNCQLLSGTVTNNDPYTYFVGGNATPQFFPSSGHTGIETLGGISSTTTPSHNLAGTATASGTATTATWTFPVTETDTNYRVTVSPVPTTTTGTPAAGTSIITAISKATTGVTLTLQAAPGTG